MEEKILVEIIVKHGSEFQKDISRESLVMTLRGWQKFILNRHKKNKCQIKVNNVLIPDINFNFDFYGKID